MVNTIMKEYYPVTDRPIPYQCSHSNGPLVCLLMYFIFSCNGHQVSSLMDGSHKPHHMYIGTCMHTLYICVVVGMTDTISSSPTIETPVVILDPIIAS